MNLGLLFERTNNLEEALKHHELCVKYSSSNEVTKINLTVCYYLN